MSEGETKKKILDVATRLFSTQGLSSTNIRQIATEAKANSALIFYYFGCKEKLFYECLAELATERFKISNEILSAPKDLRDFETKLEIFVQNMAGVFQNKRDLLKILHREIDKENKKALKLFEEHFLPISKTLHAFFSAAQENKIIRKEVDTKALTYDFFGMISNPMRNEVIYKLHFKQDVKKPLSENAYKASHSRILNYYLKGVLS